MPRKPAVIPMSKDEEKFITNDICPYCKEKTLKKTFDNCQFEGRACEPCNVIFVLPSED